VVVDSANIPFPEQAQARDSLLKFLVYDAAHRGPTAIVSFQRSVVKLVQDFTTDSAVLGPDGAPLGQKNDSAQVQPAGGRPTPDVKQQPLLHRRKSWVFCRDRCPSCGPGRLAQHAHSCGQRTWQV
jgi:hypothetical protein